MVRVSFRVRSLYSWPCKNIKKYLSYWIIDLFKWKGWKLICNSRHNAHSVSVLRLIRGVSWSIFHDIYSPVLLSNSRYIQKKYVTSTNLRLFPCLYRPGGLTGQRPIEIELLNKIHTINDLLILPGYHPRFRQFRRTTSNYLRLSLFLPVTNQCHWSINNYDLTLSLVFSPCNHYYFYSNTSKSIYKVTVLKWKRL